MGGYSFKSGISHKYTYYFILQGGHYEYYRRKSAQDDERE